MRLLVLDNLINRITRDWTRVVMVVVVVTPGSGGPDQWKRKQMEKFFFFLVESISERVSAFAQAFVPAESERRDTEELAASIESWQV